MQNAQNSTDVRPISLIPAWRTRRGEIDHALSESAIKTQNAQNSTEVRPIALTPAWRTRRGEIDHALSEYVIATHIDVLDFCTFGEISSEKTIALERTKYPGRGTRGYSPGGTHGDPPGACFPEQGEL